MIKLEDADKRVITIDWTSNGIVLIWADKRWGEAKYDEGRIFDGPGKVDALIAALTAERLRRWPWPPMEARQ